jgi:hypothetical protein
MTEAAAVARAAEHLELEITRSRSDSMAGGVHNHAHFQVCVIDFCLCRVQLVWGVWPCVV